MKAALIALCLILSTLSTSAQGIPSPKGFDDTLDLMYDFMLGQPSVDRLDITEDQGLEVFLTNGMSVTLYPDNLTNYLQAANSNIERQNIFDGHMSSILGTVNETDTEDTEFTLDQILPILRYTGYVSDIDPVSKEFPGDLTIYYAIDYPDRVEFLSKETLANTEFTEDELRAAAAENLRGLFDMMEVETNDELGVSWLLLDGYYESSLALTMEFWANAAYDYEQLIMIVPNRDYLIFGEGTDPEVREILRSIASDVNAQFNNALTDQIYRWSDKGWVLDQD